ncbi:MAG: hypothetical protein IJP86_09405 [Synergistaceae bacterium]|nr:hypothetical protein [Synergistaceae bacterium]MBQ6972552.1 hypothetical protein [Synergistaceae bacterium]
MKPSAREFVRSLSEKLSGGNPLISHIARREFNKGNYIRAAILMLYLLPARKYVRLDEVVRKCGVFTDPEYYDGLQELLHVALTKGFSLVRIGRQ